jgi:hypothetical protein
LLWGKGYFTSKKAPQPTLPEVRNALPTFFEKKGKMGGKKLRWGEDKMLEEVVATPLPDWRLNKRLDVIVSKLSAAPERSIPHALGKKDTKSTYEFLDNRRVSHAALVEGLGLVTLERVAGEVESGRKRLYLVQDTTSFDFKHHPATTGMGGLDNPHGWGFLAHTTLAVSEQGVPLGVWETTGMDAG